MAKAPAARADSDRRCGNRMSLEVPLAVPVYVRSDLGAHRGVARNISEGGMLVELEETPPIGSQVEVTIGGIGRLANEESFSWLAEVRHQVAWSFIGAAGRRHLRGVGLRFLEALGGSCSSPWLH